MLIAILPLLHRLKVEAKYFLLTTKKMLSVFEIEHASGLRAYQCHTNCANKYEDTFLQQVRGYFTNEEVPFSSIFSNADRALLVFTFPSISLTFVAVLKKRGSVVTLYKH